MPTLQEMREDRANVWSQMTEIMERTGGDLGAEDRATYDAAEARMDELGDAIERRERHEQVAASMAAVQRDGVVPSDANQGERDPRAAAYASAFGEMLRSPQGVSALGGAARETLQAGYRSGEVYAAAGVGTGAAGGYMVPPAFRDVVQQALLAYGPMLELAEKLETDSGANIPWPTNDDTANEGAILAENTAITEQDVTLGTASLDAFMYTSKLVRVSYQLMQDRPDFPEWLIGRLGERLARIYNRHATTGTGTSQPDGFLQNGVVGVTGTGSLASTGGYSYDNLVDLVESLDEAYLQSLDGPVWQMHQTVRKAVRKLKDGQGRPLWEPSTQAGVPDTLLGYRTRINNHMPTVATSSKSLSFGDFKRGYVVRIVKQNELARLNERYADNLQVGFFMFGRFDATLQHSGAIRVMQTTATA